MSKSKAMGIVSKVGLDVDNLKTEAKKRGRTMFDEEFNFDDGSKLVIKGNHVLVDGGSIERGNTQ